MKRNKLRRSYARVFRSLGRAELQRGAHDLTAVDMGALFEPIDELWMGFYTAEGLHVALERYGLFDKIRRLGYEDFLIETSTEDAEEHLFRLHSVVPSMEEPLIELVTRKTYLTLSGEISAHLNAVSPGIMSIEWLLLQNPIGIFEAHRPPLPGQHYPGSGLAKNIFELLRNVCLRLGLSGLVTIPSYYHNALLYSENFGYVDPVYEGRFLALRDQLEQQINALELPVYMRLAAKSWAVNKNLILDTSTGEPMEWFFEPMLSAITPKLRSYMKSAWYVQECEEAREALSIEVAAEPLLALLERRGVFPFGAERIERWLAEEL